MLPDTEEMRGFAALLGIAALSLAIAACGGSGQLPTATSIPSAPGSPAALASPSATSAPTAEEVSALELTHAGNVDMPDGLVLFVTSGCTGCDGPDTGIVRVYRAGDGVRIDTLFTLEKVGITSRLAYISGLVTNQEATDILISVCIPGGCYSLGHGDPDQQTALYRSKDGGVSWTQLALLGGDYRVVGLYRGAGILWNIPPGDYMAPGANLPREFLVFPEMSVLTPPEPDAIPLTNDPDLLWLSRDGKRLLTSLGGTIYDLGDAPDRYISAYAYLPNPKSGPQRVVAWQRQDKATLQSTTYLAVVPPSGKASYFRTRSFVRLAGWYGNGAVGNFLSPRPPGGDFPPGFVDFGTVEVYSIADPFLKEPLAKERNRVIAAMAGRVVRVVNTGSCLNVRGDPNLDAPVIYCARDGVLLRWQGQTADDRWLLVAVPYLATPDKPEGIVGWASAEYLE